MSIKVGDRVPTVKLRTKDANGVRELSTDELFKGRKVVLFGLPGAFTPTCSAKHLPGFVQHADELKAKGVDTIACISVNDAEVMEAWGRDQQVGDKVLMLADGNCEFTDAIGLAFDNSAAGRGRRSRRYAMVVDDGTVTMLNVEEPGAFAVSSAEAVLKSL